MEYIERKLGKYIFKTENLEITDSNINDREYSKNEILENKISLIVGESGRGKSSFLKNIEKEVENSIYKELVSLDYENNFEFEDEKIYLLDSIDEDRNEESEKTYNKKLRKIIDEIKALNSENRIILTCREGYIPNEIVKKYEIDVYKLLPITQEQINLVLGEEKEQFWDFIKKSNLEEHLGNIVILQTLIKNYKNYKTEVTISEIYMNLCKNFLEIETENEVSFIGENHDEIMEELSILMSSKYLLKEKFPNESLELNNKKLEKNKKEKLSKVPIFIGEKKEYRVYHKSIEEFLIAFYFHKKIEYKELDIEEIISIFFNESYLKIELKDIFKFLIYFENDEFKRILLEIDPTLLIEIRENNKNMQKLILLKNISILKKNPHYLWDKWRIYKSAFIDKDTKVEKILNEIVPKQVNKEVFYYLMCLLKNEDHKDIEKVILEIIYQNKDNSKFIEEDIGMLFIDRKSFNIELDLFFRKYNIMPKIDFYFMKNFLILLYKEKGIKTLYYYLKNFENIDKFLIKEIKSELKTEDILEVLKELSTLGLLVYKKDMIIEMLCLELLERKNFREYREVYLNFLKELVIEYRSLIKKKEIFQFDLTLEEKEKIFCEIFERNIRFIYFLNTGDLEYINIEERIKEKPISRNVWTYIEINKYFNSVELNKILVKNKSYRIKSMREKKKKVKEIKSDKKKEYKSKIIKLELANKLIKTREKEVYYEIISSIEINEIYNQIEKEYPTVKDLVGEFILEYFNLNFKIDLCSGSFSMELLWCFKYFNVLSENKLNQILESYESKEKFIKLLLCFNYYEISNNLEKILLNNKREFLNILLKIIKNNLKINMKNLLILFEDRNLKEIKEIKEIFEDNYLIIELDEDTEEIIMDLIIENEELLKKKIKTNKISSKFAKKYIEINGIDNYFEEIEFDKSKETFSRAIYLIYDYFRNIGEIMDSLSDGLIKRIVVFYGENFDIYERKKEKTPEREQLLYRFMQMEIMKLLKDNKKINLLKSILKNNLKNKQIENELKFILKELMEEATNKSNIIEILTRKERKNKNIYFDKDKFLNDLLIIIKHLTELRLQIKLKGYKEDEINDLIRFGLEMKDYYVYDQRRGGESETRQNIGERDFAIKQNKIIVTILEALILRFIETENIKKHYDKLNSNYDTIGNRVNYFLCYYLGNNFNTFIERYKESSSILFNSDIEDLSSEYTEKSNIKIMKTKFKEKEIYHLLINFEN